MRKVLTEFRDFINKGDVISIGLVIDAVISFVVVAFFLYLVIKAYNRYKGPEPTKDTGISLLAEIRDELRAGRPSP